MSSGQGACVNLACWQGVFLGMVGIMTVWMYGHGQDDVRNVKLV